MVNRKPPKRKSGNLRVELLECRVVLAAVFGSATLEFPGVEVRANDVFNHEGLVRVTSNAENSLPLDFLPVRSTNSAILTVGDLVELPIAHSVNGSLAFLDSIPSRGDTILNTLSWDQPVFPSWAMTRENLLPEIATEFSDYPSHVVFAEPNIASLRADGKSVLPIGSSPTAFSTSVLAASPTVIMSEWDGQSIASVSTQDVFVTSQMLRSESNLALLATNEEIEVNPTVSTIMVVDGSSIDESIVSIFPSSERNPQVQDVRQLGSFPGLSLHSSIYQPLARKDLSNQASPRIDQGIWSLDQQAHNSVRPVSLGQQLAPVPAAVTNRSTWLAPPTDNRIEVTEANQITQVLSNLGGELVAQVLRTPRQRSLSSARHPRANVESLTSPLADERSVDSSQAIWLTIAVGIPQGRLVVLHGFDLFSELSSKSNETAVADAVVLEPGIYYWLAIGTTTVAIAANAVRPRRRRQHILEVRDQVFGSPEELNETLRAVMIFG